MNARHLQIILRASRLLWRYPLRSALIMLSAALGVSGVVCSINYGKSGAAQVLDQIHRMGTNVINITPAQSRSVAGRARTGAPVTTLIGRDYAAIKNALASRTRSSALATKASWIKAGDLSKSAAVVGCERDYFPIKNWTTVSGALIDSTQDRTAARVAVLGHTVAIDLFGNEPSIGANITIDRIPFSVIGVLAERGQGLDVSNEDNQVYVPLSTAMHRLMNVDNYSGIVVEIDSITSMDKSADKMRTTLHTLHHIQPNKPEDFQIQNQKSLLDTQMNAVKSLNYFLRWIGASALAVSGLGIAAITWIAIKERTREIGTCRALGATAQDIFLQTMYETGVLAILGGLIGSISSWPISRIVSASAGLRFSFDEASALIALGAAVALNLVFAILPARKAALVRPVEALNYE